MLKMFQRSWDRVREGEELRGGGRYREWYLEMCVEAGRVEEGGEGLRFCFQNYRVVIHKAGFSQGVVKQVFLGLSTFGSII